VSKRGLAQIVMVGGPGSYLTARLINLVGSTYSVRNIYFPSHFHGIIMDNDF